MAIVAVVIILMVIAGIIYGLADNKVKSSQQQGLTRIPGFTPAVSRAGGISSCGIAIDPASNRFAVIDLETKVYDFEQLIAVEVYRNDTSIIKTNRGSQAMGAAVGGILLGGIGLLAGSGSASSRIEQKLRKLSLKLYTNDLVKPVTEIVFFKDGNGADPNGFGARRAAEELDQWHGRFRTIVAMEERGRTAISQATMPDHLPSPTFAALPVTKPASPTSLEGRGWFARTFGA